MQYFSAAVAAAAATLQYDENEIDQENSVMENLIFIWFLRKICKKLRKKWAFFISAILAIIAAITGASLL